MHSSQQVREKGLFLPANGNTHSQSYTGVQTIANITTIRERARADRISMDLSLDAFAVCVCVLECGHHRRMGTPCTSPFAQPPWHNSQTHYKVINLSCTSARRPALTYYAKGHAGLEHCTVCRSIVVAVAVVVAVARREMPTNCSTYYMTRAMLAGR